MSSRSSKPRRTREPVETPAGYLATHDLKERGWTPRLIAKYLGEHDAERPNGLKMGRRRLPPVKLYSEARVEATENDETFLIERSRAEEAREKRQAARERRAREREGAIAEAAAEYWPQVTAQAIRKGAVRQARAPHLPELERTLESIAAELGGLSAAEQKLLREALMQRLHRALAAAYPWYPSPSAQPQEQQEAPAARPDAHPEAQPSDWRTWDWED